VKKLAKAKASGNKKAIRKAQKKVKALKKKVRLREPCNLVAAGLRVRACQWALGRGMRRQSHVVQRASVIGLSGATLVPPALVRTLNVCHVSRRYISAIHVAHLAGSAWDG